MPGGLLALVCYGNENVVVNGNPQITWFYKSFQRYTHFSQEPIQIPLDGPNQMFMDAPIFLKAKIPRQGDLLSDLVLRFTLPDIFSKAYLTPTTCVIDGTPTTVYNLDRAYEFAWVRQCGVRLIQNVTFTIGGQIIQEFTSDWISARAMMDYDNTQYQKWRAMVGDVPEMYEPAQGIYADPAGTGYPNVVAWQPSTQVPIPIQNNAPSIPGRTIRIPLGLWFSDSIANSLPLVALEYHDCEITIQIRPIRDLYTILDPTGNRVRPGTRVGSYLPTDQYTGVWKPNYYGNLPPSLNNNYIADPDVQETMRHFLTDIQTPIPTADGWPLDATLEGIYTFVQDQERAVFTQKTLRYNVRQVQPFIFSGISTRNTYRLDVHNIATRIAYFCRRSDSLPYRNQPTNLTNWMYTAGQKRPYVVPNNALFSNTVYPQTYVLSPSCTPIPIGRSGLNMVGIQRRILRNVFLTANGNKLFDSEDTDYFTQYVPFRYLKGDGMPMNDYGLATQAEMWPIHVYSFALHGSEIEQPTGTLNTSRIDRLEMDVDVEPIPVGAMYTYELDVFVETLNFVEISNGMGGLKFAK